MEAEDSWSELQIPSRGALQRLSALLLAVVCLWVFLAIPALSVCRLPQGGLFIRLCFLELAALLVGIPAQ